jgi:cell filamentation protein
MEGRLAKGRNPDDGSGNAESQYADAKETVLQNKLGITDLATLQAAEEKALACAYRDFFRETRTDTPITCDLLRRIHARIFGDIYEWAGNWRTVWIKKPGIHCCVPELLDRSMEIFERDVLRKCSARTLAEEKSFCATAGEIQGEFLVIRPFREGNARTIKLMTDLLAVQTARPLQVYDGSGDGQAAYIHAAQAAFQRSYLPMAAIITAALERARRGP